MGDFDRTVRRTVGQPGSGTVTLLLPDQSALVAVVGQLHDQNITIDAVRRIDEKQ